jgi:hypothetical protein
LQVHVMAGGKHGNAEAWIAAAVFGLYIHTHMVCVCVCVCVCVFVCACVSVVCVTCRPKPLIHWQRPDATRWAATPPRGETPKRTLSMLYRILVLISSCVAFCSSVSVAGGGGGENIE